MGKKDGVRLSDGYYLICPRCGKITKLEKGMRLDDWIVEWTVKRRTVPVVTGEFSDEDDFFGFETIEEKAEGDRVLHECGMEIVYGDTPFDFVLKVERGEIVPLNSWLSYLDHLKLLLEDIGVVNEIRMPIEAEDEEEEEDT